MSTKTKIDVDNIDIPAEFLALCDGWAGGTNCGLRAVQSCGALNRGTIRPVDCDTDEKWSLVIWQGLSGDVSHCERGASRNEHEDQDALARFEEFCDDIIEQIRDDHDLADWEPEF